MPIPLLLGTSSQDTYAEWHSFHAIMITQVLIKIKPLTHPPEEERLARQYFLSQILVGRKKGYSQAVLNRSCAFSFFAQYFDFSRFDVPEFLVYRVDLVNVVFEGFHHRWVEMFITVFFDDPD